MGVEMMDMVWIIAGIFITAIAIALYLGHTNGTLVI